MARQPVKKQDSVPKSDRKIAGFKTYIMFSTEQSVALVNHLAHTRDKLSDKEKRDFDSGPLGQVLRNLRG